MQRGSTIDGVAYEALVFGPTPTILQANADKKSRRAGPRVASGRPEEGLRPITCFEATPSS
jgi:hypothetical protein